MKRILFCASRISHILNFHLPYLRYFRQQGYQIDVAAQGRVEHPLIDRCFDIRFVKNPFSPANFKAISTLRRLMRENRYEIVCSNTTLAGTAAKLALGGLRQQKPYFVHISHGYLFSEKGGLSSRVYRTVERLTASRCDALVVMNGEDYQLAQKYHLGKTVHYIYGMGLCTERFPTISDQQRADARNRIKVAKNGVLLLCVGEFTSRKNQTLLLRALDRIRQQHPEAVLAFAGAGKTEPECRRLCEELELQRAVRFLGHVSDMNTLYRSSDLLVSASTMEGLPFNVMEALYCGLPVAASRIKGHTDLLSDCEGGLLFENTPEKAAEALHTILGNEALFRRMKANAFLQERYLIENVQPTLLKILDRSYAGAAVSQAEEGAYS